LPGLLFVWATPWLPLDTRRPARGPT
jgi:hypothetical protein